ATVLQAAELPSRLITAGPTRSGSRPGSPGAVMNGGLVAPQTSPRAGGSYNPAAPGDGWQHHHALLPAFAQLDALRPAVIWSPNLGVFAVSAAGVLCAF